MPRKKNVPGLKVQESTLTSKSKNPLIFISHDTRDAEIAELFSKLLSSVSAGLLKSFRSSDRKGTQGIEYGVEWFPEIMKKLDEASDIVCLLTHNSVDRPWILYEAGVAKGKLSSTVLGIALGIPLSKANNGPFAQFQNCSDDQDSLTKLVLQLVRRLPNAEPDEEIIKDQVNSFQTKMTELFKKHQSPKTEEIKEEASVAKLFEEVKIMFMDLPSKIEHRFDPDRRRPFRIHREFLHDLLHFPEQDENYLGFLIMISLFKNEFPWIYEIGLETHKNLKAAKSGNEAVEALSIFERAIEFTFHHPISRDLVRHEKEYYFMFDELRFILREYSGRMLHAKRISRKGTKKEDGKPTE